LKQYVVFSYAEKYNDLVIDLKALKVLLNFYEQHIRLIYLHYAFVL